MNDIPFDFSEALKHMKGGQTVERKGLDGYVAVVKGAIGMSAEGEAFLIDEDKVPEDVTPYDLFAFKNRTGLYLWNPSHEDLLAEDWVLTQPKVEGTTAQGEIP